MGVGDSWGTREEFLHPRDSHGRFRNTWRMAASVVDKLTAMLARFNPRTFPSDEAAGGYLAGLANSRNKGRASSSRIGNFVRGFSDVNAKLRKGDTSDPTVREMDAAMAPLPDDVILSRVVGPEAFGLTPETIGNLEEYTGKLVADKGYASTNLGTPMPHGAGQITMSIATPAGTRAVVPATGQPSREVILDRDQPLRITKVDPDGQGGFYVYAVATEKGGVGQKRPKNLGSAAPAPSSTAPNTSTPATPGQIPQAPAAPAPTPGAPASPVVPQPQATPVRTGRPGRPAGPPPAPRTDGHVGIVGQPGTAPGAPAPTPEAPGAPQTPEPGAPDVAEAPAPADPRSTFRDAFKEAELKVPGVGKRRQEYNDAFLGVTSGKKTPQQAVDELDDRIALNEATVRQDLEDGTDSGPLPHDIEAQRGLSDLIKRHFGLEGAKEEKKAAPAKKVGVSARKASAPKKVTAEPAVAKKAAAPAVKKAASKPPQDREKTATSLEDLRHKLAEFPEGNEKGGLASSMVESLDAIIAKVRAGELTDEQVDSRLQHLQVRLGGGSFEGKNSTRIAAHITDAAKKIGGGRQSEGITPGLAAERVAKKASAPTPKAPEPAKVTPPAKASGTAAGKITTARVDKGHKILVRQDKNGDWKPTSTKTGATVMTVTGKDAVQISGRQPGGRRRYDIHGTDEQGNKITVSNASPSQTFWEAKEPSVPAAKKAAPSVAKKAAPAAPAKPTTGAEARKARSEKLRARDDQQGKSDGVDRGLQGEARKKARQDAIRDVRATVDKMLADKASNVEIADALDDLADKHAKKVHPEEANYIESRIGTIADRFRDGDPGMAKRFLSLQEKNEDIAPPAKKVAKKATPKAPEEVTPEQQALIDRSERIGKAIQAKKPGEKLTPDEMKELRETLVGLARETVKETRRKPATKKAAAPAAPEVAKKAAPGFMREDLKGPESTADSRQLKAAEIIGQLKRELGGNPEATKFGVGSRSVIDILDSWQNGLLDGSDDVDDVMDRLGTLGGVRFGASDHPQRVAIAEAMGEAGKKLKALPKATKKTAAPKVAKKAAPAAPKPEVRHTGVEALAAAPARLTGESSALHVSGSKLLLPAGHSMSDEELKQSEDALVDYRSNSHAGINKLLRNPEVGKTYSPETVKHFKDLTDSIDRVMEHSALERDVRVRRRVAGTDAFGDRWSGDLTGLEFGDDGFVSTSARPTFGDGSTAARGYGIMTIDVPKGTKGVTLSGPEYESEILLERGLRFRVTSDVTDKDGIRNIGVEVIPHTPKPEAAKKAAPRQIQAPADVQQAVARTSIADLRAQAKAEGIQVPASARTKQSIVDHIAQELARRQIGAPAKAVPVKRVPKKAAPKALPVTPEQFEADLRSFQSRVEAERYMDDLKLTVPQMRQLAEAHNIHLFGNKTAMRDQLLIIYQANADNRGMVRAIHGRDSAEAKALDRAMTPSRPSPTPSVPKPAAKPVAPKVPVIEPQRIVPSAPKAPTTTLPSVSDKPLYVPNRGADQGLMHFDSTIGQVWVKLPDSERRISIDGEPLANVVAHIGEGITLKKHDTNGALAKLRELRTKVPDDSKAAKLLDAAIKHLDVPPRALPELPPQSPAFIHTLMKDLNDIGLVRRGGHENGSPFHETDEVAKLLREFYAGKMSSLTLKSRIEALLTERRHESQEGWTELRRIAARLAQMSLKEWRDMFPNPRQ